MQTEEGDEEREEGGGVQRTRSNVRSASTEDLEQSFTSSSAYLRGREETKREERERDVRHGDGQRGERHRCQM